MKVFQFHTFYLPYLNFFYSRYPESVMASYSKWFNLLIEHRFHALHILKPVYDGNPEVTFAVANDVKLQMAWAKEKGFSPRNLNDVLLAQIEDSQAEILYTLAPVAYDSKFLKTLPGNIKKKICWLASPQNNADLSGYDLHLCNFDIMRQNIVKQGLRTAWFTPAIDPAMAPFARNENRPIDISFVGGHSPYFTRRNDLLKVIAQLSDRYFISFRLMAPKWKRLSNKRLLRRVSLPIPYLPPEIRRVNGPTVFGLDMYDIFGKSKIVFNASIDMMGNDRGNMRCFEALGCGAAMISDDGNYTDGFSPGKHFSTFKNETDLIQRIKQLIEDPELRLSLAKAGNQFVESQFTKQAQWEAFCELAMN